jgi:hypothetical protein
VCGVVGKEEENVMGGYKRSVCQMANTECMYGLMFTIWRLSDYLLFVIVFVLQKAQVDSNYTI